MLPSTLPSTRPPRAMTSTGVRGTAYATIPEWVLDADISARAVHLFGILGRYVGANEAAWPSRRTLAERLRCSTDTLDRAIVELVDIGAVTVERRYRDDGSLTSSLYYLWPRVAERCSQDQRDLPATVPLDLPATMPEHERALVLKSITERENAQSANADARFEEFWTTYPKRNGKRLGKAKTIARWNRLSDAAKAHVMVGVVNYAAACNGGLTLAKDPERWLRDRCSEDWQEPAQADVRHSSSSVGQTESIAARFAHRDEEDA